MTPTAARPLMRLGRLLLLMAGVGVVGYMVWQIGPGAVWESLSALSWWLVLVICFPYALSTTLDTLGWRLLFAAPPAPFSRLWAARLAGEAVNITTPTASVGGEPVKAYLLRAWVPLPLGLASVVVDKTAMVLGQGVFLALGLVLALGSSLAPAHSPVMTSMLVLLAVEVLAVGGFVIAQLQGLAGRGGRLLARFGMAPSAARQEKLEGLDRALAGFYRGRRRIASAILVHAVAYVVGSLEIYIVLNLLGIPVSLLTAVVIESFGAAVKFASFMVPGSLGALEGGNIAIFAAFGLGGAVGLSYTLIRRLREIAWVLVGLAFLALHSARPALPPGVGRPV
jgi:putative membrane protein